MKAEIIAVGTELLMGETQDTNSSWISSRLPQIGLDLEWITIVGDDLTRVTEILDRAWRRSDVVFTIGGLGPTLDDLTRDGIAKMLGEQLTTDPSLQEWLEDNFRRRSVPMPQQNIRQAGIIPSAVGIKNPLGTAPSWWIERDEKILATLPGPPNEMMNMWTTEIEPRLKARIPADVIMSRTFKTIGLGEASVDEMVREVYDMQGLNLGVYAKPDGIWVRPIARAHTEAEALTTLLAAEEKIRAALGDYIWGTDEDLPPKKAGELLQERGATLAVLESCTGGLLAAAITDIPGASGYFMGGAVTYTKAMKVQAGVSSETIDRHGVYSPETASAMAEAARSTYGADYGIGITGVAGPGDSEGVKPGSVWIAVATPEDVAVREYTFPSRRPLVRNRAVTMALLQLVRALQKQGSAV